eukprot:3937903-Rhodomonas_salina.2
MRALWPGSRVASHRVRKVGSAERVENVSSIPLGHSQPRSGQGGAVDHWYRRRPVTSASTDRASSRDSAPRSPSRHVSKTVSGRAVVMPQRSAVAVA